LINARVDNWPALGWLIERQYPTRFSKPEIQISLNNSFNQTLNTLSITVSAEEVKQIEVKAAPVREKVRRMLEAYRPSHGNGDQETNASISKAVQEKFANYRPGSGDGE
jgi:hypothetical protein